MEKEHTKLKIIIADTDLKTFDTLNINITILNIGNKET
jgi:hypothetical protein